MISIHDVNSQTNFLMKANEIQDITDVSAATFQGGLVRLYNKPNGTGWLGTFRSAKKRFSRAANDKVSSVRITSGIWYFWEHWNYQGRVFITGKRGLTKLPKWFDNKMSSLFRLP